MSYNVAFAGKVPTQHQVQSVTKEIADRYVGKTPMGDAINAGKKIVSEAEEQAAKALAKEYSAAHATLPKAVDPLSADKIAEAYRAAHGIV